MPRVRPRSSSAHDRLLSWWTTVTAYLKYTVCIPCTKAVETCILGLLAIRDVLQKSQLDCRACLQAMAWSLTLEECQRSEARCS